MMLYITTCSYLHNLCRHNEKIINCGQKTFQCQKPVLELIDSLQSTNTWPLVCDDLSSFLDVSVKEIIDLFKAQGCFRINLQIAAKRSSSDALYSILFRFWEPSWSPREALRLN